MQEPGKFDFKINVGLEKYMSFNLDNQSVFIISFNF